MLRKRAAAWKYEAGEWKPTRRPGRKITLVTDPELKNRFRQQQTDLEALQVRCDDQTCCECDSDAESW